ncbi:hypothetical protein DBR32_07115 [Taibaiella sp. KBW10]|nr:hypothetical protein DBR32_07115 [Taibaiella sp. KBW10]
MNMSVFSAGYYFKTTNEKGQKVTMFNQIDSLLEYIVEVAFEQVNAFPEGKEHTEQHHPLKHIIKTAKFFDVTVQEIKKFELNTVPDYAHIRYTEYSNQYNFLYFKEINPPPPKLV